MRRAIGWLVCAGVGVWGCGSTKHEQKAQAGTAGVAGAAPTAAMSGAAGDAGGETSCGVALPAPPLVDAQTSAAYSWTECGHIPATPRAVQALYGAQSCVLVLRDDGSLVAYAAGTNAPVVLVAAEPAMSADQRAVGFSLSADGRRLSVGQRVLEATDGGAIGVASELREVTRIDATGATCSTTLRLAPTGAFAASMNASSVCLWRLDTAELQARVELPTAETFQGADTLALSDGPVPLRVFRGGTLFDYDAAGALVRSFPLVGSDARAGYAAFSQDGASLVLASFVAGASVEIAAFDAVTGVERWRHPEQALNPQLAVSNDGYVLVAGGQIYALADGSSVGKDSVSYTSSGLVLGAQAKTKLVIGEQVAAWDLNEHALQRLYGGHSRAIRALDVTPDGRYLASHGQWAVTWELASDFAESTPLFHGVAPDSSWDVALAPDGASMLVSGDNIGYFRRGGSFERGEAPPATAGTCLSADWAYSPDGCWLAGTHYSASVRVRGAQDYESVAQLDAADCGGGVAFTRDGQRLLTASLELYDTRTWKLIWSVPDGATASSGVGVGGEDAVEISPRGDEFVVTRCRGRSSTEACRSERRELSTGQLLSQLALSGDRVRYSPEGHWLVSGKELVHLPSGTHRNFAEQAAVAVFTAQGDVVAGNTDGSLTRYCRR